MTLTQFLELPPAGFYGTQMGTNSSNIGQCVGLIYQYLISVLGISNPGSYLPGATAYDIWLGAGSNSYWTKVDYVPGDIPSPGDIIFWGQYSPHDIGSAGHTDVNIDASDIEFLGFDQNWNGFQYGQEYEHDYGGVVGYLHLPSSPPPPPPHGGGTLTGNSWGAILESAVSIIGMVGSVGSDKLTDNNYNGILSQAKSAL